MKQALHAIHLNHLISGLPPNVLLWPAWLKSQIPGNTSKLQRWGQSNPCKSPTLGGFQCLSLQLWDSRANCPWASPSQNCSSPTNCYRNGAMGDWVWPLIDIYSDRSHWARMPSLTEPGPLLHSTPGSPEHRSLGDISHRVFQTQLTITSLQVSCPPDPLTMGPVCPWSLSKLLLHIYSSISWTSLLLCSVGILKALASVPTDSSLSLGQQP